ncbi:hypothetical protein CPB84DRAFT_1796261 [Gymnopilus junonius]|uniref:Uncharacterized protein n=1 Tax=Gymnopilus junonius TaxID=109634 RepID=A0A9P5NCP7_GYMJU|nr:hypothetical protein CPB84DRAFT_1796261 [Gymnopilus junonius]
MPAVRGTQEEPADAILPMIADPWMAQISHPTSIKRIWFYLNAPQSCIKYICEIDPLRTPESRRQPLEEGPLGNKEFNERHEDWKGYDYAYKIRSVYELRAPVTLSVMRDRYGFKSAPRSIVFVKDDMKQDFPLYKEIKHRTESLECDEGDNT